MNRGGFRAPLCGIRPVKTLKMWDVTRFGIVPWENPHRSRPQKYRTYGPGGRIRAPWPPPGIPDPTRVGSVKTKQRRLPRRVREQQLIDAAVSVFSRGEYHTVSVEEIAVAAGTSKPTVYHYLGSKEGIFTACVNREMERLVEAVRAAVRVPPHSTDEDPLRQGMRAFFGFVIDNRESWTVLYRRAAAQGQPFAGETLRMRDRVTAEMADLITTCTRGVYGDMDSKDAQLLARVAVSTADAFADWVLDHPDEDPDTMAGYVTELTWSHLNARGPVDV